MSFVVFRWVASRTIVCLWVRFRFLGDRNVLIIKTSHAASHYSRCKSVNHPKFISFVGQCMLLARVRFFKDSVIQRSVQFLIAPAHRCARMIVKWCLCVWWVFSVSMKRSSRFDVCCIPTGCPDVCASNCFSFLLFITYIFSSSLLSTLLVLMWCGCVVLYVCEWLDKTDATGQEAMRTLPAAPYRLPLIYLI